MTRSNVGTFCRDRTSPAGRSGVFQDRLPREHGLIRVGGAHDGQVRDVPQRPQVLDGLVRRAVLAQADRVVRPDERDRDLHQRREPHGAAHVVAELQERPAVRPGEAGQRDAVQYGAHAVLADAEVQRAPVRVARPHLGLPVERQEGRLALHRRVVGLGQVRRPAPQLGQHRRQGGEDLAGRAPGAGALGVGGELRQGGLPAVRAENAWTAGRRAPLVRDSPSPTPRTARPTPRAGPCRGRRPRGPGSAPLPRRGSSPPGRSRGSPWSPRPRRSPSAEPCAAPVFCLVGAGQPMIVRSTMNDGLSVTALAASIASYSAWTFSW